MTAFHYRPDHFRDSLYQDYNIEKPEEISGSIESRRAQFLAGRLAAKQQLFKLGIEAPQQTVSIGQQRQPLWPKTLTGSISHTDGVSIALVIEKKSQYSGLGVDIQAPISTKLCDSIAPTVINNNEDRLLRKSKLGCWEETFTICFSAKESIFKALFYHVGDYFDFDAVSLIRIDPAAKSLTFRLNKSLSPLLAKDRILTVDYVATSSNKTQIITVCRWEL